MAPALDPEFARHLCADSDSQWTAYCRGIGAMRLLDANRAIRFGLHDRSYSDFVRVREPLERACVRLGFGFARAFDYRAPRLHAALCRSLPDSLAFEGYRLERRYGLVATDTSLDSEERLQVYDRLHERMLEIGDAHRAMLVQLAAARCELECGRSDRHRDRLESGLAAARALEQSYMVCQALGELGVTHWAAGDEDSMRACFDEGIAIALRLGLLDQSARLFKFYASFHAQHGRLALAADRLAEVQRVCEAPGGGSARARMLLEYARFMADLDCWDLVERSLRRFPPLLRAHPVNEPSFDIDKLLFDADRLRARLAFATGRPDEGNRLLSPWRDAMLPHYRRMGYAELFDEWSAGLARAGATQEALAICERGLGHCDSAHVPERAMPLRVRRAQLLEKLDRLSDAHRAVDDVARHLAVNPASDERLVRETDLLRARLTFRSGQPQVARRQVKAALDRFQHELQDRESGAQSYLELDDAVSLRNAVHEIEGLAPEVGYRFEMEWRSLASALGGAARVGRREGLLDRVHPASGTRRNTQGMHLVYHFTDDVLMRWTASAGGVVLDTLPISASQCLAEVRDAIALLQTETPPAGAPLGPRAHERLRGLAQVLLPSDLRAASAVPTRLRISADGPLLALPFEALPAAGPRGEEPLALWTNIGYVRGWGRPLRQAMGREVIVSNPALSPELQRRHGLVALAGSEDESQAARERWPSALLLQGERATKDVVLQSWTQAPLIYLAAHHVRDPDAPFLGFVPLAAPNGAPPDAAFLEIADIHSLDLSGCRLVVLASCASGAPYRLAVHPGPGLGDAFLDSGARAVVQSFWNVGDEDTREFMKRFLATWRADGDDDAALADARRAAMATPAGASPRVWAAWSVQVTLPREARSSELFARTD